MANYPYIIASFPDLLLDFEQHPLDASATVAEVKGLLSEKDCKLVDWLEFGLEGSHLTPHFYRNIRQTGNRFLTEWFAFDRKLRLAKVAHLEGKPVQEEFPELDKAEIIFKIEDILQREKLLDRLCWNKAAELVDFDIFTIDTILSLITRLHILARWNRLDPQTGASMFRRLVDEVRGTFQGINEENI
ncbi:MAG: DUF2764 family protein [Bacteroidales bacterium]|nr:DUF2764 family protein [Bacteroidales bacterium]